MSVHLLLIYLKRQQKNVLFDGMRPNPICLPKLILLAKGPLPFIQTNHIGQIQFYHYNKTDSLSSLLHFSFHYVFANDSLVKLTQSTVSIRVPT